MVYDKTLECTAAVIWFHGGMFPSSEEEITHTRENPLHGLDDVRGSALEMADIMGGPDFASRGGRAAAVGSVNKVAWTDTRDSWAGLVQHLGDTLGCDRIVTAGGSSGGWAAIELASTYPEVRGAVVSNAATNLQLLRAISDQYLQNYEIGSQEYDPGDPSTDQYCTRYIRDLTYACVESGLCQGADVCPILKFRTGWVADHYSLFKESVSGALPVADDSQYSSSDPFQVEILGVFPLNLEPGMQEGYNRRTDLDVYPDCRNKHSLFRGCTEGRAIFREKIIALIE